MPHARTILNIVYRLVHSCGYSSVFTLSLNELTKPEMLRILIAQKLPNSHFTNLQINFVRCLLNFLFVSYYTV